MNNSRTIPLKSLRGAVDSPVLGIVVRLNMPIYGCISISYACGTEHFVSVTNHCVENNLDDCFQSARTVHV